MYQTLLQALSGVKTIQETVTPESMFVAELGFESIDLIDLMFVLSKSLSRDLSWAEVVNFLAADGRPVRDFSVGDMLRFLEKKCLAE